MAGTTNLLQWNPTAVNQETDTEYSADSQRAGGATNPSLFDATLANKAFYQWSTYLTALFTAFANKNFTTSDSNLSSLTAQCANFLTTADILPAVQIVPYAATLTFNAAQANGFYVSGMTGNLTISAISGLSSGQLVTLSFQQDSVGGRTVTYPALVVGAAQPDPTANAVSAQLFEYDATTSKLRAIGPLVSDNLTATANKLVVPALTLSSPGSAGQVLTNVGGVFVPQNVPYAQATLTTPSRTFGTIYLNSTGRTLFVSGSGITSGSSTGGIAAFVGITSPPSTEVYATAATATIDNGDCPFAFVVPNGSYYKIQNYGVVYAVRVWTETLL